MNKNVKLAQALIKDVFSKDFVFNRFLPALFGGIQGAALTEKLKEHGYIHKDDRTATRIGFIAGTILGRELANQLNNSPYALESKLIGALAAYPSMEYLINKRKT